MKKDETTTEVGGIKVDDKQPWRTENLGRLLLHALNLCERRVLERLDESGFGTTRQVHLNIMRHVDSDGTRMSDLATRLGITNGATTQAVELCVAENLVKLAPDKDDRRVRRVFMTSRGKRYLEIVHASYDATEAEISKLLGDRNAANLRKSLLRLKESMS